MREPGLRTILLAQACEDADPEGAFVPHAARDAATRDAVEAEGVAASAAGIVDAPRPEALLETRADRLLEAIAAEHPSVASRLRRVRFTPPVGVVWAVAFAFGLLADGLGRERQLNLLAFPLLGLLAWNLAVYAAGLVRLLSGRERSARRTVDTVLAWSALGRRFLRGGGDSAAFARRVSARFAVLWLERAGGLEAARLRACLHGGAVAFALGVIAGLYLAGFAFAYQATWESTFLEAGQVRTLLSFLLGPASGLSGLPLPDVAGIAAIEAPASGPAAAWIHRWATTVGLLVVLPRIVLALRSTALVSAAARRLTPDLESAYAVRLLAAGRGEGSVHAILPYSMEPTPAAAAQLRELAHDLFGNRARVRLVPHVPYGGAAPVEVLGGAADAPLVVFDLAQSPEREVHGAFLETLARGGATPLVVLDHERYQAVADPERVAERRRAWSRVLAEVGVEPIDRGPGVGADALIDAARAVLSREPVPA